MLAQVPDIQDEEAEQVLSEIIALRVISPVVTMTILVEMFHIKIKILILNLQPSLRTTR